MPRSRQRTTERRQSGSSEVSFQTALWLGDRATFALANFITISPPPPQARHKGITERTFLTSNFFPLPLPSLAPPFLTGPFLTGFLTVPSSGAGTLAAAAEVEASGSTSMADMVQSKSRKLEDTEETSRGSRGRA